MIKHAGNIGDGAVRDQSVGGLPEPKKDLQKSKVWYGNEREKANLSIHRRKMGVLMKVAT